MSPEDFGSKEAGRKGGKAAANRMTPEQRAERARRAAESRWGAIEEATHEGEIPLGKTSIPCAVLEDGTRVLTQQGVLMAIGRARSAKGGQGATGDVDKVPAFLAAKNLKPYIDSDLRASTKPIRFRSTSGTLAFGYKAELLPEVCNVYLAAREAGALHEKQEPVAKQCEILLRGLGTVGITALVDSATGYERDRARDELAKILEAFVAKEIQKWIPTFPLEFYELICEIRGEPMRRATKRPAYLGKITNNLVYDRLAPGVRDELQRMNPANEKGNRKHRHHQFLTPDMGHPKLREHLAGVISVMRVAKAQDMGWQDFLKLLNKTHKKQPKLPLFDKD